VWHRASAGKRVVPSRKLVGKEHRMEDFGERITGTKDEHYNLISVLYHALHGADNCDHYALDAEASGEEGLATFFREAQAAQVHIAERGKQLLGIVEAPPEFGVESGTASGGSRPEAAEDPTGRGVPPRTEAPRTPPSEEDRRGRGGLR
jgi:hypothetical protein